MNENVLCIPSRMLRFEGVNRNVNIFPSLVTGSGQFLPREEAEKDENWKQVIPYVVFASGGRVMSYKRGKGGNESRLKELRSIGIGGHIKSTAGPGLMHAFLLGKEQELGEEINVGSRVISDKAVALINDNSTPVGRVHMGVVFLYRLVTPIVSSREPDKIQDVRWDQVQDLLKQHASGALALESWTRLVLEDNLTEVI